MQDINYDLTGYEVIHHGGDYIIYLEKNKKKFGPLQLRYPTITSLNGEDSAIMRILNSHDKNYVLMQPYLFGGSHKLRRITNDVKQTMDEMVRGGLQKEVALLLKTMTEIGYIDVENTNRLVKNKNKLHRKHLINIDDYDVYPYRQYRSKYFVIEPVWLSTNLEERVFNQVDIVKGETKPHPQLQCYETFNKKPANNFFKI